MGKGKASGVDTIPDLKYKIKPFDSALSVVKEFIFIRHGEKPSKDEMHEMKHSPDPEVQKLKDQLNPMGRFRAANLWQVFGTGKTPPGAYSTPDVIYAMKAGDEEASERPYETVEPLAKRLGMIPQEGERMPKQGGNLVFDNRFEAEEHKGLLDDVEEHCKSGDYAGKTLMFCWEHKNIPYIVARFGLIDHGINWGLNPDSGADDNKNFTAIWVFKPSERSFKVYQEFSITADESDSSDPFILVKPQGGYSTEQFFAKLNEDSSK